jgi:hypothetical protein
VRTHFPRSKGYHDRTVLIWPVCSAAHLQVSRAFLLQQAAWLYERELSQIQAQMRRVGGPALSAGLSFPNPPSPRPQSPAVMGGIPMARTGTGGTGRPPEMAVHNSAQREGTRSSAPVRSNTIIAPRVSPGPPSTPTTTSRREYQDDYYSDVS